MNLRSERFDPQRHLISGFSCGEPSLDAWLAEQAAPAEARRTARTWVWADQDGVVDATQTVAARLVVVDALHEHVARFYEALGFRRIPESLLLVHKVADIESSLRRQD